MTAALLTAVFVVIAVLWCLTPIALFGVRTRLSSLEDAYRRHTEELTDEIQKLNAILAAEGHRILVDPPTSDRTLLIRNPVGRA